MERTEIVVPFGRHEIKMVFSVEPHSNPAIHRDTFHLDSFDMWDGSKFHDGRVNKEFDSRKEFDAAIARQIKKGGRVI